jgi:hypothetical protein
MSIKGFPIKGRDNYSSKPKKKLEIFFFFLFILPLNKFILEKRVELILSDIHPNTDKFNLSACF